jgi:uncharacterized protein YpiB (UPF0302 family)
MFIQLNFPQQDKDIKPFYLGVLEANPFQPNFTAPTEDTRVADKIVGEITAMNSAKSLQEAIDHALDTGNKELFMELTDAMIGGLR